MIFLIDIDDHLLLYPDSDKPVNLRGGKERYYQAAPNKKEIDLVNKAYNKGHTIMIFTSRNWDQYDLTKKQLEKYNIKHHELIMGKPQGIFVDRDSKKSLAGIAKDVH